MIEEMEIKIAAEPKSKDELAGILEESNITKPKTGQDYDKMYDDVCRCI